MAVKIPQNIEREDKLVGPLTLKQFLYVLGGGGLVFTTYQAYVEGYLFAHEFFIISFLIATLTVSFAFLPINGRPFVVFLGNAFSFIFSKKLHLWNKDNTIDSPKDIKAEVSTSNTSPQSEAIPRSELEKLATVLDTGGKIKTDSGFINAHEINTLPSANPEAPEIVEEQLGVEDIFENTDV